MFIEGIRNCYKRRGRRNLWQKSISEIQRLKAYGFWNLSECLKGCSNASLNLHPGLLRQEIREIILD